MKRIVSLFLMLALVLTVTSAMAGCNSSSPSSDLPDSSVANNDSSSGEESSSEESKTTSTGEVSDIVFAYDVLSAGSIADMDKVQEEINKITEPELGVNVTITPIQSSSYEQQITLMTTSGEPLDVIMSFGGTLSTYVNDEKILPLNDLLESQGQGIKELLGDYLRATTFNGEVYAIPTIRDLCRGAGLMYDVGLANEVGLDMSTVDELEDFTEIFQKIQEVKGDDFPCLVIGSSGSSFLQDYILVDQLNDFNGVLMNFGLDNTDVTFYEETQEYSDLVHLFADWYKAGYIQQDITTTQESKYTMLQQDLGFCYFTNCKPGIAETATRSVGRPMDYVQLADYFATTAQVASFNYSISQNCLEPEKAMAFLNALYTDERIATLLGCGIEGIHYEVQDNGQIAFPEGVTEENTTYFPNVTWAVGNQFATPTWSNDPEDLWERQAAANDSAKKSLALGFAFDNTNVSSEITAINNVRNEYRLQVETGACDVDTVLPEYIQALRDAGMDTVIAEKQEQLDAWLEQQ